MSTFDYKRQVQEYYSKAPLIVLGSGASAAHGMSGMAALADHLTSNIDASGFDDQDLNPWRAFCDQLGTGVDLESALHKVSLSEKLGSEVIRSTWALIQAEDEDVFSRSLLDREMFPLGMLISHMFKSSLREINIVTTNYDRIAEYACDRERIHHYTGFTHGFLRHQISSDELSCRRRVNIWKVHGSIDWFASPSDGVIALANARSIPDQYVPQIVTPGTQKYQKTHLDPFRTIISNADRAITAAGSYLCVGFGFNDEHIQPKLVEKCSRESTPITIICRSLSENAKKLVVAGKTKNYIAIERDGEDGKSIIHSSLAPEPIRVEENLWSLSGYLSLVM